MWTRMRSRKLLGKFKSKEGDVTVYGPGNLLIITDSASNIRRMLRLVEEVDVGGAADQIWVEKIHYAVATELATKLNEIFDIKPAGKGAAPAAAGAEGQGNRGSESDTRISKIIAEERTNSLIIVATERAYLRILEVIKRLDVQQSGSGDIHVLTLQHAMAEELAQVLNNILTGIGQAQKSGGSRPAGSAAPGAAGMEGVFEGTVKITADKATNSLVITSSLRDYAALRTVIDQLDHARRQVFIEAVIMDLSVDHSTKLGVNYHLGAAPDLGIGSGNTLMYGGLNPLTTILTPSSDNLQGLALGVRGPGIEGTTNLLGTGLTVPAFGVIINALATSGDANVLATPHIIATDNVAAEISVGENIPLQTNVGGISGLSGLTGTTGSAATSALGGLGMLGGYGMGMGYSAQRQDVGTKIKVVPHINDSNEVRLELTEEISERGASSGTLGAVSITKRTANTTVVVKDQQTVVIGGLMRDAVSSSQKKVPVLGDIPLLGFLFRSSETSKRKTNLLLVLTPYIIRDQRDLRTIFERKMQERQEFLDRYFVFSDQKKYEPPRDFSRTNGLLEDIRQSQLAVQEKKRLIEEAKPKEERTHKPGQPIEWVPTPGGATPGQPQAGPAAKPDASPPKGPEPARRPNPVIVNPTPRSVGGGGDNAPPRPLAQMREDRFLGEVFVKHGLLPQERLESLFELQKEKGSTTDIVTMIVSSNIAEEAALARALAAESGLPYVGKIDADAIPTGLAGLLPITYAKNHRVIVVGEENGRTQLVVADPFDTATIDAIRALLKRPVEVSVAAGDPIIDAINRVYERQVGAASDLKTDGEKDEDDDIVDILDSDDEAPIIRWVRSLYRQAIKERASDIHIEPEEREVVVRYRIDGKLYVAKRAPRQFMNSIVSRVKIEAGLNIAEKRLPQDGRISFKIAGKSIDVRVSTVPTSRGFERIVMRLLHKTSVLLDLTDLGFSKRDYGLMGELIVRPNGIILVTGPTGSGKTTTLYACLNRINRPDLNILTAEDPVEYEIGGIHQVHVQPKIGLTFASALRSFLRQDPDVIMVGEIRDRETAEIAIHASLTGHLVLSTIHTNDAASAVTRLVEMGIEPFLVRSSVIGILAQRLVRVLCPQCKEPYTSTAYELSQLGIDPERSRQRRSRKLSPKYQPHGVDYVPVGTEEGEFPTVYRAKGCDACMGTGFMGRRGIYELLIVDDAVGPLILRNADAQTMKRVAMEKGMDSLRDDGARKALEGLTTTAEVVAATQEDVAVE